MPHKVWYKTENKDFHWTLMLANKSRGALNPVALGGGLDLFLIIVDLSCTSLKWNVSWLNKQFNKATKKRMAFTSKFFPDHLEEIGDEHEEIF